MKNLVKAFCAAVIILTFFSFNQVNAQVNIDNELKTLFLQSDSAEHKYNKPLKGSYSEFELLISTGFLVYKTVISSQDEPRCVFTPSCSEYSVEAFRKKGPFIGWLETFDRLSRCHGFVNYSHYHFDQEKKRFYDPLQ